MNFNISTYSFMTIGIFVILDLFVLFSVIKNKRQYYLLFLIAGNSLRIVQNIFLLQQGVFFTTATSLFFNIFDVMSVSFYIACIVSILNRKTMFPKRLIFLNSVNIIIIVLGIYVFDNIVFRRLSVQIINVSIMAIALYEIWIAKDKKLYNSYRLTEAILILYTGFQFYRIILLFMNLQMDLTSQEIQNQIVLNSMIAFIHIFAINFATLLLSVDVLNIKILELSIRDDMTKIYNRRFFFELLDDYINTVKRKKSSFSLAMFDIDDFKKVNDKYGHVIGDQVLIGITDCISSCVRASDDVARYGGEEFIVLFKDINETDLSLILTRILTAVQLIKFNGIDRPVTISGGASIFSFDNLPESSEQMVEDIDNKLYEAKSDGKNQVVTDNFVVNGITCRE